MPQSPLAFIAQRFNNAIGPGKVDQQQALWETQRHSRHYAATYGLPVGAGSPPAAAATAGALFRGSNSSGATLSAGLATTYTGLCLSNPATSTKNLVVKRASGVLITAPGAFIALGLITGWALAGITVHTTGINANIVNGYVGAAASGSPPVAGPAPLANLDAACTLVGTPLWDRWITGNNATGNQASFYAELDDDAIIPPGGYMAIGSNVAGPGSGLLGTFMWEELIP